ncbi:MAG: HAMP domain-containing histidine kinase, partial [Candidatus Omnitrophica bacterium]|nr:HAMP domain-containing histidine kinase [Candidatus Omnitrophota bacterium]
VVVKEKRVEISFQDTGCGIPKEDLEKLFGSFFSTKKDSMNLGLGLSISKRIVEEHQGTVTVASEVGKGTTFTITIPEA